MSSRQIAPLAIGKDNGAQADSLDAGNNSAAGELICTVDVGSILGQDALGKSAAIHRGTRNGRSAPAG